ncbi:MAG TPA: heavy metal-binding domain-containing protein [Longimicrobiaceae bacterium]|jgi:uncharacterized protein YbjQ (UPF0145 family)|nr:heavy metal-binding domain-containing protein [Longimicrobiaceae bacterium]
MLITTTSSLEGWTIEEYLEPVSAEIVIGTGLFTDVLASWSDFFGMDSRSYMSKLDQIRERALAAIEYKALRVGANALLGLHIDYDEISAGSKSMLMVSAMGTPVRARHHTEHLTPARARAGAISAREVSNAVRRRHTVSEAAAGKLDLKNDATWNFILDNGVHEIAPLVLKLAGEQAQNAPVPGRESQIERFKEFFFRMQPEVAAPHLYEAIERDHPAAAFAQDVVRDAGLIDLPRLLSLLTSESHMVRARAVLLARGNPPFYTADDLSDLERLRDAIVPSFRKIPASQKKGLLGGERSVWACGHCKSKVDLATDTCNCGADRYGLPYDMSARRINPEGTAALIAEKIEILRNRFADSLSIGSDA